MDVISSPINGFWIFLAGCKATTPLSRVMAVALNDFQVFVVHFPLEVRAFICHFHFPGCAVRGVSWGATYAHLGGQMASVV